MNKIIKIIFRATLYTYYKVEYENGKGFYIRRRFFISVLTLPFYLIYSLIICVPKAVIKHTKDSFTYTCTYITGDNVQLTTKKRMRITEILFTNRI